MPDSPSGFPAARSSRRSPEDLIVRLFFVSPACLRMHKLLPAPAKKGALGLAARTHAVAMCMLRLAPQPAIGFAELVPLHAVDGLAGVDE